MFKTLGNLIRKENSAIIVWDVQEALVSSIFNKQEFLSNLREVIEKARTVKIPIFYTKITLLPSQFESPLRKVAGYGKFEPGDIVKEVYPTSSDIVINKNTASIFIGTNFELMVRNAGINSLFFTGIATEIGIETSVRHAQNLGFIPLVVRDAVSSRDKDAHERSLKNMSLLLPVISTSDFLSMF
ncbi:MAG: isochorismatase family cysteine hydrolase [Thermoplasmatales archaeon]